MDSIKLRDIDLEEGRKYSEEFIKEARKSLERKCFCDKAKEEESRDYIRKQIIEEFTYNKDAYDGGSSAGFIIIRPHTKEIDVIHFVEAEEYTDDILFPANAIYIDYCPWCGRKL